MEQDKDIQKLKFECHLLIDEIWGKNKTSAYYWLREEFGKDFHFADINDIKVLEEAMSRLTAWKLLKKQPQVFEDVKPDFKHEKKRIFLKKKFGRRFGKKRIF